MAHFQKEFPRTTASSSHSLLRTKFQLPMIGGPFFLAPFLLLLYVHQSCAWTPRVDRGEEEEKERVCVKCQLSARSLVRWLCQCK